jgi:hypothetical protein
MAWTTPRTWATGELVTKTIMDTHIRDNLNALKDPPSDEYAVHETSDYYTTSGSFVDVYSYASVTITTTGGDVLIVFFGVLKNATAGARVYLDVEIDGSSLLGGDDGLLCVVPKPITSASDTAPFCLVFLATGIDAGEHTFVPQWKVSGGTAYMYAGAGTTNYDLHPQLVAREVS